MKQVWIVRGEGGRREGRVETGDENKGRLKDMRRRESDGFLEK